MLNFIVVPDIMQTYILPRHCVGMLFWHQIFFTKIFPMRNFN